MGSAASRDEYTRQALLGRGAFGEVELVQNAAGERLARKCFSVGPSGLRSDAVTEIVAYALTEDIPGIVHARGVELGQGKVCILTDLYEGNIIPLVMRAGDSAEERVLLASRVFRVVMVALRRMHARGAMHLDVKPANILYRGDEIALGDMGLVYFTSCSESLQHDLKRGSPKFMAPEGSYASLCKESDYASTALTCMAMLLPGAVSYQQLNKAFPRADGRGVAVEQCLAREAPLVLEKMRELAPGFLDALELCLRVIPEERHGAALDAYLGVDEPVPWHRPPRGTDRDFAAISRRYFSLYERFPHSNEEVMMYSKLLDAAWRLHMKGKAVSLETYSGLYSVVRKLYVHSGSEVLFPGASGEEIARHELSAMEAMAGDVNFCGSDSVAGSAWSVEKVFE